MESEKGVYEWVKRIVSSRSPFLLLGFASALYNSNAPTNLTLHRERTASRSSQASHQLPKLPSSSFGGSLSFARLTTEASGTLRPT